eukprot:EG_transcript_23661
MVLLEDDDRTSVLMTVGEWSICLTQPDNPTNFMAYYHSDDDLDSDFLMAPVNEADYDSETQFCVDKQAQGGPSSFYDHFVTKRKKKKLTPKEPPPPSQDAGLLKAPKALPRRPPAACDLLAPPQRDIIGNPRLGLSNTVTRRLACGRMPPAAFNPEGEFGEGPSPMDADPPPASAPDPQP